MSPSPSPPRTASLRWAAREPDLADGPAVSSLHEWLRRNSERYLVEAAQADMARRYLGHVPDPPDPPHSIGGGLAAAFWRRVYVPVYRRIPWPVRRRLIVAMPGSHRRRWQGLGDAGGVVVPSSGRSPPAPDTREDSQDPREDAREHPRE